MDPFSIAASALPAFGGGGGTKVTTSSSQAFSGNFAINPTISIATAPGAYSYPTTTGNASGSPSASASAMPGGGSWPSDYPYDPAPGGALPVSDVNKLPQLSLDGFADVVPGGMATLVIAGLAAAWYVMK